jgi:hypothetical protein
VRVIITNGDAEVDVSAEGGYSPDVFRDLVARAVQVYREAFVEDEDDE